MISNKKFVWLHLPKTGGTSTARSFRNMHIAGVHVDPETEDMKHESIEARFGLANTQTNRLTIITSRRLVHWLLSDWHHKTIKMGLDLPFAPTTSGLFYSLRLGGTWVAADYWLRYFKATSCDRVVRLEHLEEDSNKLVLPLLPAGTPNLKFPDKNRNKYNRKMEHFFSTRDLNRIYSNNPIWSAWEEKIYGNRSTINPLHRISAKIKLLNYLQNGD